MFQKRSSLGGRKVSPPQPTCMTDEQKSSYLDNLRNNRPARPTGSRPPTFVSRHHASLMSQASLTRSDSAPAFSTHASDLEEQPLSSENAQPEMQKSVSFCTIPSTISTKGRPVAQPSTGDRPVLRGRKVSPTAVIQIPHTGPDEVYIESVARQLEKEEAHKLRQALQNIDQKDDEQRIYAAAQDEAADLVWKHRNPQAAEHEMTAPYTNPDLKKKDKRRSSGQRQGSASRKVSFPTTSGQIYEEPLQREVTAQKPIETPSTALPLRIKSTNTLPWLRRKAPEKTDPAPTVQDSKKYDIFELHKNPRVQSNNAEYTSNTTTPPPTAPSIEAIQEVETPKSATSLEIRSDDIRAATSMKRKDRSPNLPTPTAVSDRPGRPIVSFERGWKPPSDSPRSSQDIERPIIILTESPSTPTSRERPLPRPIPEVTLSAPEIPSINLPDEASSARPAPSVPSVMVSNITIPTINLPNDASDVPPISIQTENDHSSASVPSIKFDNQVKPSSRPLPRHADTVPKISQPHKTPSTRLPWLGRGSMPTVSCSSCALPISGRIVTASGSAATSLKARFHPECFSCHHCSTPLECVSFYPEPDNKRADRLENEGIDPDSCEAANDPLRFYCHLDFHEFFSPRCRSCKTPIEGEVVVAAGAEWHVGHFFCAECGDPFDSSTPFVERDNYAYCVRCHTKRTSARCRQCKNQILDELTVEALGGKYHEACFVCSECGGGFGDEGRFFIRDVPVEPTEKEKRKGITRKMEEKPVCGPCEEIRLKA